MELKRKMAGYGWLPLIWLLILGTVAPVSARTMFIASESDEFRAPPDRMAMILPSAVAVDSTGTVFVADGANDRIVKFNTVGRLIGEIRTVGEESLSRPLGIKTDAADRLWIADTGHGRLLVCNADGHLDRLITVPPAEGTPLSDPTDMLPLPDNRGVWVVDNDSHRLLHLNGQGQQVATIGGQGETLRRFHYPFMIARGQGQNLLVSDVINSRVQILKSDGQAVGVIGDYGLGIGQLYRPKGIACDALNRVWISDSLLGMVQIFEISGRFIGVLHDSQGEPMRFDTPTGLTFDGQGRLYVVEARPGRVRRLQITEKEEPGSVTMPSLPLAAPTQPKACTICHIEWMQPLVPGADTKQIDSLSDDTAESPASRSEMCLSCHDGSVVDSRRLVWQEHGHRDGVEPPASMKVPADLPLVNGRIACRTCHAAHASEPDENMATAIFLRRSETGSELCEACHVNMNRGVAVGAHPVRGMPWVIPEDLLEGSARQGPDPSDLTCRLCHMAHGPREHHLLVPDIDRGRLCLSCHTKLRPGLWLNEVDHGHPQTPPLSNDLQRQAIADMGVRIGENDTLTCLSCHKIHQGATERYLLADTLNDSRLCIRCHPDQQAMLNSPHDLRSNAPFERNRLGQTPAQSGPCGVCHGAHQYARRPDPQSTDESGTCATCHQAGRCAEKVTGLSFGHPLDLAWDRVPSNGLFKWSSTQPADSYRLVCVSCHDPHQTDHGYFLIDQGDRMCGECHPSQLTKLAGDHDFGNKPDLRNARNRGPTETGKCGFCHGVHETSSPLLWSATANHPEKPDEMCLACHVEQSPTNAKPSPALEHPSGPSTAGKSTLVDSRYPLYDEQCRKSLEGSVSCASCHDVHGDSRVSAALMRGDGEGKSPEVCLSCHPNTWPIEKTRHSQEYIQRHLITVNDYRSARFCAPCHTTHAVTPERPGLQQLTKANDRLPPDMKTCLECHDAGDQRTVIQVTWHPVFPVRNVVTSDQPGFLPLADEQGRLGEEGRVTCQTCHLPHGRPGLTGLSVISVLTASESELRGWKTMLRPYTVPNLCSSCHGSEGLVRFLYYHHPEKRRPFIDNLGGATLETSP